MTSAIFKKVLSRRLAVQALYQWQLNEQPIETVIEEFKGTSLFRNIDPEYFIYLLTNIGSNFDQLKEIVDKVSDLSWEQIQPVEKGVILIGALELRSGLLDPSITINECVELSKHFGSEEGYKFINGVLDSIKMGL
ncbi:MAG: transcription antitermination factor NusB [Pseudomonadota bacterium]|nr:transcription antitermination factor NusB [Pseudomonadota bacterium]